MPYPYPVSHPLSWALSLEGPTSPRGSLRGQESLLCTVAPPSAAAAPARPPVASPPLPRRERPRGGGRRTAEGAQRHPMSWGWRCRGPGGGGPHPLSPSPFPPSGGRGEKCAAQGSTLGGRGGIGEVK